MNKQIGTIFVSFINKMFMEMNMGPLIYLREMFLRELPATFNLIEIWTLL